MEIRDTVSAVIGRRHPIGPALPSPAGTGGRANAQRTGLVEGEGAIREVVDHVLDAVELDIPIGIGGFLPRS
ncbi:hypothetical protein DMH04_55770 [Kibdelosporangium aridum]|uniref:Uncharacterized protein n=1 Tax=Kibdelosporangium aridum TaxID=2030 RepID=A0A428XVU7_KIBAR|nr:hypothetical protein [Kibdelosporangium aridum]RSM59410.1 hypothetical protein DMH04_55770 [Kibdelosporangium aridum]